MSFSEVEMGLPPVNEVASPTPSSIQQQRRLPPNYEDIETDTPQSSLERISTVPPIPPHSGGPVWDDNEPHPTENDRLDVFRVAPTSAKPTKRTAPAPPPRLTSAEQDRVYSLEETDDSEERAEDDISRARRYGGFVLILLPGVFGALAVQFIKYLLDFHHVYVLALCVFQGIFWPSLFFVVYTIYWMKRNPFKDGWRNSVEIMVLSVLASCAVILQIVSLLHIDITVSLAISFSPLVFMAMIEHISLQKRFPVELLVTSLIAYLGLVLLSMTAVTTSDGSHQRNLLIGIGTAIGSMTLAVPASLLLSRLRRNQVEDSVTGFNFAFTGTLISLILMGAYLSFGASFSAFPKQFEAHPGFIASLVAFVLCATLFQILDSIYRGISPSTPTPRVVLMLSATRMGVFVFSGIWEVLKRGFYPGYYTFPSVFSIFGVILLMISCGLTVGYQSWYKQVVISQQEENKDKPVVIGKPFAFFPWLFSRSFI